MRKDESLGAVLQVPEQEDVDVDRTLRVSGPARFAAERSLDRVAGVEHGLRLELDLDLQARVEEVRLADGARLRLGLVDRRGGGDADAFRCEEGPRPPQVIQAIALVRAEAQEAPAPRSAQPARSLNTSTATSATGSGIGGSGLAARTVTSSTP
jgi:hypothetical protein